MSKKILITAGPTREPIDEVRFISNRSSGQLGIALARSAAAVGHKVILLLGPVLAPTTLGERVEVHRFQTTQELQALIDLHFASSDLLVMAAAVADYRLHRPAVGKTQRSGSLKLELEPTPDLVAEAARNKQLDQRIVAFALEQDEHLEKRAKSKMKRKAVDAIVANPLSTMDDSSIDAVLLTADGLRHEPGEMSKAAFADWLIEKAVML
jgi:phosphopantothenoylcysteine decarboxylase/phosphopantothenate--cysteine ligase